MSTDVRAFAFTTPGTDDELATQPEPGVVLDLLSSDRRAALDEFALRYAAVRAAEGRELEPDAVTALPYVDADAPMAAMWAQRAASWEALVRELARHCPVPGRMVDVGAGCGWLAARMADAGWSAAAVDVTVDGGDGLAAAQHHDADLILLRCDMATLPFASGSVDLVVHNAALHYAADPAAVLDESRRIAGDHGIVVVMDSPVYRDPAAGRAMVNDFDRHVRATLGVEPAPLEGRGFLLSTELDQVAQRHGIAWATPDDPTSPIARFHAWRGARRAGREVARRPLLLQNPRPTHDPRSGR